MKNNEYSTAINWHFITVSLIFGVAILLAFLINRIFVLIALLSIPCICYTFWRGYVIFGTLIALLMKMQVV